MGTSGDGSQDEEDCFNLIYIHYYIFISTYSMDFDVLVAYAMRSFLFCCEYDSLIFMSNVLDELCIGLWQSSIVTFLPASS